MLGSEQDMVPTGLENRENWEKRESIFQSGKSQGNWLRLEKSGNFAQDTGKIRKKYTGKVGEICQPVIVKTLANRVSYLNKKKNFKKYWKTEKHWKSREICQSEKVVTMLKYCR